MHGLKGGLFGVVAGVGAVVGGLLEIGRETANAATAAGRLATRLGTTTDAAQELAFAAEATGSSTESLQTSMFHMSRAIEAARTGSAEAQKALSGLGVPLAELVKMSPDEQFEAIAEGLKNTANQGQKATKAQGIFGRGVLELLPLINKGKEGIQGFREEAQELGIVLLRVQLVELLPRTGHPHDAVDDEGRRPCIRADDQRVEGVEVAEPHPRGADGGAQVERPSFAKSSLTITVSPLLLTALPKPMRVWKRQSNLAGQAHGLGPAESGFSCADMKRAARAPRQRPDRLPHP